jgi:hypothetical protein
MSARERLTETFLWPALLTILLLLISATTGVIAIQDLWKAGAILAGILIGIFAAQFLAARSASRRASDDLYSVVSSMALARPRMADHTSVLSEAEVLAIEATAREVWIYAYDLAWENDSGPFDDIVKDNLARGVKYRYLVPDEPDVHLRARHVIKGNALAARKKLLQIRCTRRERLITQFGMTIYNPSFLTDSQRPMAGSVAVFFPHFGFTAGDTSHEVPFVSVKGRPVARLEEAYAQYWDAAQPMNKQATAAS